MKRKSLPGKLQENTKLSSNSFTITPKYQSIEVVQLYETSGKMAKCYDLIMFSLNVICIFNSADEKRIA